MQIVEGQCSPLTLMTCLLITRLMKYCGIILNHNLSVCLHVELFFFCHLTFFIFTWLCFYIMFLTYLTFFVCSLVFPVNTSNCLQMIYKWIYFTFENDGHYFNYITQWFTIGSNFCVPTWKDIILYFLMED